MKKLFMLLSSVLTIVPLLVGCGCGKKEETIEDGLNVAIVSSPSGVDDGSFNQNIYEGILRFMKVTPDAFTGL